MIRVFDAFSGIGGFRSAFERVVGFKTVGWYGIIKLYRGGICMKKSLLLLAVVCRNPDRLW